MTDKTRPVSARVTIETADELESRLKREGKSLRDVITEYAWNGIPKPSKGDPLLREIADRWGIAPSGLLEQLNRMLRDGDIRIEGGEVVVGSPLDLDGLYEVCHEWNIDLQDAIDRTVNQIRKGKW